MYGTRVIEQRCVFYKLRNVADKVREDKSRWQRIRYPRYRVLLTLSRKLEQLMRARYLDEVVNWHARWHIASYC